jgi:hypothetical protein
VLIQEWRYTSIIPALKRLKQESLKNQKKFKTNNLIMHFKVLEIQEKAKP